LCLKTQQQIKGLETGIGMEFAMYGTTRAVVTRVIDGGPAQLAGVEAGDFLVGVNDIMLDDSWTLERIEKLLAGDAGTEVVLKVQRTDEEGVPEDLSFTLTRKQYETQTVTHRIVEGLGYVRIYSFNERTDEEFREALVSLVNTGIEGLILDVRNNGGGYLTELCELLDYLLPEGEIFVSVDESGKEKITTSDAKCIDLPMAVLVNENTYSAAEFFAAALREHDAATIVGAKTTGKNRSQTNVVLVDGSAVHISSKRYLTPNRVDLTEQGGLTPDVEVEAGENDPQLAAALDLFR
jgi:carboxyl-terminal processing protease